MSPPFDEVEQAYGRPYQPKHSPSCNVISKNCKLFLLQITSFSCINNIKRHWRLYSENQSLVVFEDSRSLRQCCNRATNVATVQLAVPAKDCYFVIIVACLMSGLCEVAS